MQIPFTLLGLGLHLEQRGRDHSRGEYREQYVGWIGYSFWYIWL